MVAVGIEHFGFGSTTFALWNGAMCAPKLTDAKNSCKGVGRLNPLEGYYEL